MDPIVASAGLGLLGGLFNSSSQDKVNKEQLVFAKQQLAAQQQMFQQGLSFNSSEAQKSRDFNKSMMEYQNFYNSPAQQIQRMKAAGVNPDLMYGNGQLGASAASPASSSPASASGGSLGASYNPGSTRVGDAIMNALSIERQKAEIDNIKQNTANSGTQNKILQTEASFLAAIRQNDVTLQELGIVGAGKDNQMKDEQIENLRVLHQNLLVERSKLGEEIKLLQAQYADVSVSALNKTIDAYFKSPKYRAEINQLKAQYKLTNLQAEYYAREAEARIRRDTSGANLSDAQASNVSQSTDLQKQDFDYSKPYKEVEQNYYQTLLGDKVSFEIIKGFRMFGDAVGGAVPVLKYIK